MQADSAGAPTVRVGIVSWNVESLLDACLEALPAALVGVDAEVVVVDNASRDASANIAEVHGFCVVRNDKNLGYAKAMNQALSGTQAPVLLALNPDTAPPPGSLATLVRRILEGPPDIGLMVPALVNSDGSPQHSVHRFPSLTLYSVVWFAPTFLHRGRLGRSFLLEPGGVPSFPTDVDWAIGAVHVIRREALGGCPPYDERFFMYVEDLDLCWRLAHTGWRTRLDPTVRIPHIGNASGAQAWGDTRFRRYMEPSYRWYAGVKGVGAMRAWAALNVVGTTWWALRYGAGGIVRLRRSRVRAAMGTARIELPVHLWALRSPIGRRAG